MPGRVTATAASGQYGSMAAILVVEDERDIRDILRRYLQRAGFAVVTTGSGAEALRLLADSPPDLVLLDPASLGDLMSVMRRMAEDAARERGAS